MKKLIQIVKSEEIPAVARMLNQFGDNKKLVKYFKENDFSNYDPENLKQFSKQMPNIICDFVRNKTIKSDLLRDLYEISKDCVFNDSHLPYDYRSLIDNCLAENIETPSEVLEDLAKRVESVPTKIEIAKNKNVTPDILKYFCIEDKMGYLRRNAEDNDRCPYVEPSEMKSFFDISYLELRWDNPFGSIENIFYEINNKIEKGIKTSFENIGEKGKIIRIFPSDEDSDLYVCHNEGFISPPAPPAPTIVELRVRKSDYEGRWARGYNYYPGIFSPIVLIKTSEDSE